MIFDINFAKFLKFWFPVLVYSVIIFAVSSIPNLRAPMETSNFDKVIHLSEYLVLGALTARALKNCSDLSWQMILMAVILFCALYGFSDELHQFFVPGRDSDWKDLLADSIGGALGAWIYGSFAVIFKAQEKKVVSS